MVTKEGTVTADPSEMATVLRDHRSDVFCHRRVDNELLEQWLEETLPHTAGSDSVVGLPGKHSSK